MRRTHATFFSLFMKFGGHPKGGGGGGPDPQGPPPPGSAPGFLPEAFDVIRAFCFTSNTIQRAEHMKFRAE